jgi:glycosyltransferase involved in cell wall biosynthesis
MDERRVILMLITNLNFGGAQRVFYNLSLELSKHYRVVECVFNFELGHVFKTGNEIVSLDVSGGKNVFHKFWQFILRVRALRRLKKELNPAICISHLEGADLVNVLSKYNEKTITWVHGSKRHDENIEGLLGFIRHWLVIPFTYQKADKVITVSKAIKSELISFYKVPQNKIETCYNSFDIDAIQLKATSPIDSTHEIVFKDKQTLVFSGRLVRQKNPQNFIHWFTKFNQSKKFKLVIIGDGDLRDDILLLCQELKLVIYSSWSHEILTENCDVYFLGYQDNPFPFVAKSTAFILPSLWEGFPMALGEAMACGVPVIAANCPTGPQEMLMKDYQQKLDLPIFADYGLLLPILKESTFDIWSQSIQMLLASEEKLGYYREKSIERSKAFAQAANADRVTELVASLL